MQIDRPHIGPITAPEPRLRAKAAALETAFLTEMLRHVGLGTENSGFGGGIGAEQFASFLREGQAAAMVQAGGLGLAESLFRALTEEAR